MTKPGSGWRVMAPNFLKPPAGLILSLFCWLNSKNPIVLTLLAAAGLSLFLRDSTDAVIILVIVLVSVCLVSAGKRGCGCCRETAGHRENQDDGASGWRGQRYSP